MALKLVGLGGFLSFFFEARYFVALKKNKVWGLRVI